MNESTLAAAAAAVSAGAKPIEVTGNGTLAQALCGRLGADPAATGHAPPAVVVETTGEPEWIRAALQRVADLGTVVLVGPVKTPPVALDLYAHLHVRGLTIVGVPPPSGGAT